ncbi:MAG: NUDIX domain-containing protein [Bacteroidota bacterium]
MNKVFFKERVVTLRDDLSKGLQKKRGLFYRYRNQGELQELVEAFHEMEQIRKLRIFHDDLKELETAFRACFTCIDAGGGVVRNAKGEFLAIERNGVWDLPKGKMERGEDFKTTALREVEEETGLEKLELGRFLVSTFHTYTMEDQLILKETQWFEMQYRGEANPVLQSEEGITASRWVKPGEAGFIKKSTYKSIVEVLKAGNLV